MTATTIISKNFTVFWTIYSCRINSVLIDWQRDNSAYVLKFGSGYSFDGGVKRCQPRNGTTATYRGVDIIFVISTSLLGGDEPNFGQFSRTALFVLNGLVLAE